MYLKRVYSQYRKKRCLVLMTVLKTVVGDKLLPNCHQTTIKLKQFWNCFKNPVILSRLCTVIEECATDVFVIPVVLELVFL